VRMPFIRIRGLPSLHFFVYMKGCELRGSRNLGLRKTTVLPMESNRSHRLRPDPFIESVGRNLRIGARNASPNVSATVDHLVGDS